jgi:hypothetical protein
VPVEWLRFGGEERRFNGKTDSGEVPQEDMKLLSDFQLLNEGDRQIVREFVRILVRSTRERQGLQNG